MRVPALRCALGVPLIVTILLCGCSADWPAFRHDALRTGAQLQTSPLSDPAKVPSLHVVWKFPNLAAGDPKLCSGFRASPIVYKGRVFIGNGNGYFYALNARNGHLLWQYPAVGSPPLDSVFHCGNLSSVGIASSAVIAKIQGTDAVIFAAPDPSTETHLGEGRLFALEAETGEVIWKSPVIARLNGCTRECKREIHENLGHSSPLVLGDKVYVGVSDHCDNPVQKGRVAAVHLADGSLVSGFSFCSVGDKNSCSQQEPRGGGVWSPPAGWQDGVYITTGNTHSGQNFKPVPNYGLSLLRLDATTGDIVWAFQPVPWELDADPDWSAAPTVLSASCGPVIISTQKDGWTHAVNAADGVRRWSFPPHDIPFKCEDCSEHGDTRYMRSGAVWGNVYVTMNGGLNLRPDSVTGGYRRLHAFNVCEPEPNRLRWLVDVPDTCCLSDCRCCPGPCCGLKCNFCLGNPTVTRGIVYIGTNKGHLVAIADPSLVPPDGLRCANPDVPTESCSRMGYRLVPQPRILANVPLLGSMAYTEPVLVNGQVYVSTDAGKDGGYVYRLQP